MGRRAEDGAIDPVFQLKETPLPDTLQRTEWNVRDSEATLIFSLARELTGGSLATLEFARSHDRPCLHLSQALHPVPEAARLLESFIQEHQVGILNVAGPRVSTEPDIESYVEAVLEQWHAGGPSSLQVCKS